MAFAAQRRVARGRGAPFGLREDVVEAGADQAGADRVDADALRPEFLCHRAGIGHQRALRGRIDRGARTRSEEHTSELQSLMRNSYAVFCLKNKKQKSEPTRPSNTKHTSTV